MIVVSKAIGEKWAAQQVCGECGGRLSLAWGGLYGRDSYVLICGNNRDHKGIARPFRLAPIDCPGFTLYDVNKNRRKELTQAIGEDKAKALAPFEQKLTLTNSQATFILRTVWPEAPDQAVVRGALICAQYGLNPLMKHLALAPFWNKKTQRYDYEPLLSIKATRIMASPQGHWSYLDDTPRVATEAEGMREFGEDYDASKYYYSITKLKDMASGREAHGFGLVGKGETIYGMDKGNTARNQANTRSERQALDRLYPNVQPVNVDVVDEKYVAEPKGHLGKVATQTEKTSVAANGAEGGEVVEGGATEVLDAEGSAETKKSLPAAAHKRTEAEINNITTLGDLFTACFLDWKFTKTQVLKELNVKSQTDISETPAACYRRLRAVTEG